MGRRCGTLFCVTFLIAFALLAQDLPRTGHCPKACASFDKLLVSFMKENKVPGAALAVVRNGKLVVRRGYGFADRERKEPVEPDSLFRIASVSKPITAVAILKLAEDGKLHLDDKVAAILGLAPKDPRFSDITVHQLLRHQAGFDRGASFDPMFRSVRIAKDLGVPPPAKPEHSIRYMERRPLDVDPGARYAYSNSGYCLLGRVV